VVGAASAAVVTALSSRVAADPPAADEIGARVQKFYDAARTFRATFNQDYLIKVHGVHKASTGNVVFEKPGKMSWRYDPPNGNRVVSDGNTLKVYEQENAQVVEVSVAKAQLPAALSFLLGSGSLTRDFTLRRVDTVNFPGGYVLEGTPKSATAAYQKMLLFVDAQTNQVRRAVIVDAQGNTNSFEFNTPAVNVPVDASEFTFTPPPGTKVVKQ
jgi:outer membrane lipoprotein carrier protein